MSTISHRDLPPAALRKISARQRSYIDEFTFKRVRGGSRIEAWYAGEHLSTWDGRDWQPVEPLYHESKLRDSQPAHSDKRSAPSTLRDSRRPKLDACARGYVEAALWSSMDNADYSGGEPLDENYSVSDVSDETLSQMAKDCAAFEESEASDIEESGLSREQVGHNFWLTRNGHGTGFWDRGLGKVGDRLTKASKAYGSYDLYIGDDGKIYGT